MYKICSLLLIAALATSCGNSNNSSNTDSATNDTSVTQYRGVENVNGNIPDTAATGAEPNTNYHSDSAQ
ncbi:hypothetical protein SAMN05444008_112178 [Cnuella takakiae]|uniref:Uncharacterized protein n=1 Tax=Cnuella takakiae TaxID=1302690 RepID=A0A1M5ETL6_9BACT|nr:hypothetical protein [Cnuella takakiae]OLY91292.1 hypothetical protein BUE76_04780 [Cnuella takakiae]SHF82362.1 hypothetical protein SAMN05444008_112178 [Cnuella takakiae]